MAVSWVLLVGQSALAAPAASESQPAQTKRALDISTAQQLWKDDFDGMMRRRVIRVAVPYSRSLFFFDAGRERGVTVDMVRKFEDILNTKYRAKLERRPITVVLLPTTRDQLVPMLLSGQADIAAGNITITAERQKLVDFSEPMTPPFSELVVSSPDAPKLRTIEDLAGKTVTVRLSSSYHQSLVALNERFRREGKAAVRIAPLPEAIEDEDALDMVNAGLIDIVIVDSWIADLWSPLLTRLVVHKDIVVRREGQAAWAFRKGSPLLKAEVDEYRNDIVKKYGVALSNYRSLGVKLKQLNNAKSKSDWERFNRTVALFRQYADEYRFDYLLLAAQGYQESGLDQSKVSPVGAVGIMQIMPTTGSGLGVGDIKQIEPNIHAGAKYLDHLMATYFADAKLTEQERTLFAFAAYNVGPARLARLRKQAAAEGYNPDIWFNNVERVVAAKVGQEPVNYVRNIFKYYTSYKLAMAANQAKNKATEKIRAGQPGN